ncbi:MAG: hypothetical protein ACYC99_12855 [Candidatus Geothermincolia bacterium]
MSRRALSTVITLVLVMSVFFLIPGTQAAGPDAWTNVGSRGLDGAFVVYPVEVNATAVDANNYYVGATSETGFAVWRTDGSAWTRIAVEGLGNPANKDVDSMCFYNGKLYAGIGRHGEPTGTAMYTWDGSKWTRLTDNAFGHVNNMSFSAMTVFEGKLYVGTFNPYDGAQVWRFDGSRWAQVNTSGFDGDPLSSGVDYLMPCGDDLYAAVRNNSVGAKLYKYDGATWSMIGAPGFGDKNNNVITCMDAYGTEAGDFIIMGTHYEGDTGCQVWKYDIGAPAPTQLVADGFGAKENIEALSIAYYNANVYIGTHNEAGFQVWSNDGTDWTVWTNRLRGGLARYVAAMKLDTFNGKLYGCMGAQGGPPMRVFNSLDGTNWAAAAEPGFAQHDNTSVESLAVYQNRLYAATLNPQTGAEIFRKDGAAWTPVMTGGFGRVENMRIPAMVQYGDFLYAGTSDLCCVYRYDGSTWTQVNLAGFGNPKNQWVSSMVVLDGFLYAGTGGLGAGTCEVYRYDGTSWALVNTSGFGNASNDSAKLVVHNGRLYAGTDDGAIWKGMVWRYDGQTAWTPVSALGFGITATVDTLVSYNGKLYVGLFRKQNTKSYVYRWDGPGVNDWVPVAAASFGTNSAHVHSAAVFDGCLYMGTDQASGDRGAQVWRYDGQTWEQANSDGFGKTQNYDVRSLCLYGNALNAGVYNEFYGAEVWQTATSSNFYFAEGTTRPGFDPYFTIANPGDTAADVTISYMKGDGTDAIQALSVAAHSRATAHPADALGVGDDAAHDFSAKITCAKGQSIVVERPMYFDYQGWTGGSDVMGTVSPASTYYFAEGTTRPGFETYFTIANPGGEVSKVTLTYMKGDGKTSSQNISVAARSRATVHPADVLGVGDDAAHDFSAKVECTNGRQIVAERPVYFDYDGWTGGTDVMGAVSPASTFYFAEGTTRPGFDPYFCVQNPAGSMANVTLTYMKGDGTTIAQNITVGAHSRATVRAKDALGSGDDSAHDFSATVACTNGNQVVVERPMYFDYKGWTGGSDVIGATMPATAFSFAEGTTRPNFESYFTVGNPGGTSADVTLTYMKGDGREVTQSIVVPAGSRATVHPADVIGTGDDAAHDFSTQVLCTNGARIVVERPMYFNYNGWTGGHDVMGFTP